ncbi:MAG: zincin-like metallopeptidase domain-containing protein [Gallionella sp.]|nr:zincin-like metallopeptidase domain-containing protein [Gallionella sp.]
MKDIYAQVTNRIIEALETGTPPWVRPWQASSDEPRNLLTEKPYRGVNVLMLYVEASLCSYVDNRWLTFKQANEIGARVRKGEHGTQIVFYRMREIKEGALSNAAESDADARRIPLLKTFTVFNVSQLDSVPEKFAACAQVAWSPIAAAEETIANTGAVIQHGGNRAFYRPTDDMIQLPSSTSFSKPEDYYATALHELCHWTGHPRRLNRVLNGRRDIEAYAYEELIAEIGAAFLCAHCGLSARLEHASYVSSWLDALRRDKRLIFVAAGAAQKAADFVLGTVAIAAA